MRPKILIIGLYCSMLSACASGIDLAKAEIDDTIHTSSVTTESDLQQGQALFWANAETGSRGSITSLVEYKDRGTLCRRFRTTRESFDGVSMYSGDTCLAPAGAWRMRAFDAL